MAFKRRYTWIPATIVLAGLCFVAGRFVLRARTAAQVRSSITPFTLKTEITSFAHSAQGEVHRRQTIAVRSDGSRSVTETILGSIGLRAGETKRSIQFADGRAFTIFPSLGVKNTWPLHSKEAIEAARTQLVSPPENCLYPGWTFVENDTVQGQEVAVVKHASADLGWSVTAWRAPQLGCEMLKYISYQKAADGSMQPRTQSNAVSFDPAEPDPALFDEAATYREARPAEVGQMIAEKYHLTLDKGAQDSLAMFEQGYSRAPGTSLHTPAAR